MLDPRNTSGWSYSMASDKGNTGLTSNDFAAMTFGPAFNQAVIAATQAVIAQGGYLPIGQGTFFLFNLTFQDTFLKNFITRIYDVINLCFEVHLKYLSSNSRPKPSIPSGQRHRYHCLPRY